ncbi:hypothetical protein SPONN_1080 [uncultured Candidatus Thioglobus sp.]|nr:hypothetical protein SPONN_1080 [uncultured Candidatus Thioglobus sp.]SMN00816.1 hypothetical protein SPONL_1574 [uncultured Candidatus Thioglobus sp.]
MGVRLPAAIAKTANLHLNQKVCLNAEKGKVVISPVINQFDSLSERLTKFDISVCGGEVMQTDEFIGSEKI